MAASPAESPPQSPAEARAAASVPSALLLAFTGGVLDAFLFVAHGKVFAGAMTGNMVLTGIAILSHHVQNAVHQALPIVAFAFGIWLAYSLESTLSRHAAVAGLALEIAGLLTASFLPGWVPDAVFIIIISGVAGFQISTFRTIDEYSYNATFITGNMRATLEALHNTLDPAKRSEAAKKFRDLALVFVAFLAGAVAGALLTPRMGNRALWLPCAALLLVLVSAVRRIQHAEE